jgi:ribosomal protein S18 acetylase RimI-like enzyme
LVTVLEKYEGMGIGQQLTERCIDFARTQGEQVIALHTAEFMDKARHIYEKIGFRIVKEIPPRYGKRYWLYEMNLRP